jgi:hypothetical protein
LQFFKPYVNKCWTGHYVNSEDSAYTHSIKWDYILDSKSVIETKTVPELNFKMETLYYFDWESNQISFISLMNKEMNSSGIVWVDGSKIIMEGKNYFQGGSAPFKKSYEISQDGNLIDTFFRKKGDLWVTGHLIKYSSEK